MLTATEGAFPGAAPVLDTTVSSPSTLVYKWTAPTDESAATEFNLQVTVESVAVKGWLISRARK